MTVFALCCGLRRLAAATAAANCSTAVEGSTTAVKASANISAGAIAAADVAATEAASVVTTTIEAAAVEAAVVEADATPERIVTGITVSVIRIRIAVIWIDWGRSVGSVACTITAAVTCSITGSAITRPTITRTRPTAGILIGLDVVEGLRRVDGRDGDGRFNAKG